MRRWSCMLLAIGIALTACGKEDDMNLQERAEARAVEARAHIDDLAARVGTDPEVRLNTLTACIPGQDDSGLDLVYTLHVRVEPGAAARLTDEISAHFAADGWVVKHDPVDDGAVSVRFQKGTFTMGANVSEADEWAAVSGSGGCVR